MNTCMIEAQSLAGAIWYTGNGFSSERPNAKHYPSFEAANEVIKQGIASGQAWEIWLLCDIEPIDD